MKSSKRASLATIAEQLGVSIATVSRALNNNQAISEPIRIKVRKLAEELCYTPHSEAVSLKRGRRNTIGIIVPNINRSFFSSAIEGIENEASKIGMDVLISHSKDSAELEQRIVTLLAGKVDGIIASIAATKSDHEYYNRLCKMNIPLVLFDRIDDHITASKVAFDDLAGAISITNHFLEQGLKRIYHFAGPQQINVWKNRKLGYLKAMNDAGIEVPDNWIIEMQPTVENGVKFARYILDSKELPQAIFFTGDYAAIGAISEFKKAGIHIPNQIAISGFANEPFCDFVEPSLTSIDQSSYIMGQTAFKILMKNIEGEPISESIIKPNLIIRKSSIIRYSDDFKQ